MKRTAILALGLAIILQAMPASALNDSPSVGTNQATIETAFSPEMGATSLIVKTIKGAKKTIRVAAYSFTSRPIEEALKEAYHRGIDVKVVADKSNLDEKRPSSIPYLAKYGVPVRINSQYAIMHNKFMVVDSALWKLVLSTSPRPQSSTMQKM